MSLEQVDMLLDRIKVHYPFFMKDFDKKQESLLKKEWYKVLINYDNIDVNRALDIFLKGTKGSSPAVYELVNSLSKISDKVVNDDITVFCTICKSRTSLQNYQNHYKRCLSIDFLSRLAFKYSKVKLRKEELYKMNDGDFETFYWDCCRSLIKSVDSENLRHLLENSINAHEGKELNLNFQYTISENPIFKKI